MQTIQKNIAAIAFVFPAVFAVFFGLYLTYEFHSFSINTIFADDGGSSDGGGSSSGGDTGGGTDAGNGSDGGNQSGSSDGGGSSSGGDTGGSSSGGSTSDGGGSSSGGNTSDGGGSSSGGNTSDGGGSSSGGNTSDGGGSSSGGNTSDGGGSSSGGNTSDGGGSSSGGNTSDGGGSSSGGNTSDGGGSSSGGNTSDGGGSSSGGNTSDGGGSSSGGFSSDGGGSSSGGESSTSSSGGNESSSSSSSSSSSGGCPVAAPSIVGISPTAGAVGIAFSAKVTVSGDVDAVSVSALPPGLSFNQSTNTISGTPTATGSFNVQVSATNQCGGDNKTVVISISDICPVNPPVISSQLGASGTIGSSFAYTITGSNNPTTFTLTGTLPTGLTFNQSTGVISGTPTQTGTFTVTIGVTNQCGNDTKQLTIVITGGGGGCVTPTITLPSESITGTVGTALTFTFSVSGATTSPVTIAGTLPAGLTFDANSLTISGTPTASGAFDVTFGVASGVCLTSKALHIVINPVSSSTSSGGGSSSTGSSGGGSSSSGGGGGFSPTVTLLRATTTPLAALGFISLTQVPYTGVGDLFFTIFFILALFVVSALIAYVVTYGNILERAKAFVFGTPVLYADETMTEAERAQYSASTLAIATSDFDPRVPALNNRPVAPTYFSNVPKAIENTAALLSMNNHDDAIADEIAQGLSNVSRAIKDHKLGITTTTATDTTAISQSFQALEARIEVAARAREVVIGQDGVHLIATAADGNDDNALRILEQVIEVAREWQPTHEGTWLSISGNKVREILFSTYLSMVPAFVRWIAHGEGKKVFSLIRILNHQGHSVGDFLRATVHELDAVYRFRTERMGHADLAVLDATKTWKRVTLEKVIAAIVSALDESYASPYIAGKLALSKALQASEEDAKSDDQTPLLRDVIGR